MRIDVPSVAKVVIDGRSGVVLLGGDVNVNSVSVAVGIVTIREMLEVVPRAG